VKSVTDKEIFLEDGTILESHFTIIATEATTFLKEKPIQSKLWKSCDTLYFETEKRTIHQPLIGLIADTNTLINNIFYHTRLQSISVGSKELLSVTVVKNHGLDPENLQKQVENELQKHCGISSLRFLKHYAIPKALPQLKDLRYEINPKETQFSETIFLAGDVQLNGSINAAMLAGERAALGVLNSVFQD
jgi:hypothetical protein